MLFAGSKPQVQSIIGLQEQNKICLQTDPPQCFDIGNPFEQAESGGITNKVFDKSLNREGGFKPPLPGVDMDIREILRRNEEKFKAEVPETWNEGTGIEKGGYENAPQWLRDQMWKQDLRRRQELGLEPVAY